MRTRVTLLLLAMALASPAEARRPARAARTAQAAPAAAETAVAPEHAAAVAPTAGETSAPDAAPAATAGTPEPASPGGTSTPLAQLAGVAPAASAGHFPGTKGTEPGGSTDRLILALAFVALAAAATWWLRRRRGPGRGARLEVVESVSIGPKRSLLVVSYGGRALLLGSTEQGVTVLHEGAAPEPAPELEPDPEPEEEPSFESLLADSIEDRALRLKLRAAVAGGGA